MTCSVLERWLAVPGYEGRYEVSDHGRLRYLRQISKEYDVALTQAKILAVVRQSSGYLIVSLWMDNKVKTIGVHRLVLTAFVGPPPAAHIAAHWDGVRDNNRLENLRWATQSENMQDKRRHGTQQTGERASRWTLTEEQVRTIRGMPGSHRGLGKIFGVSHTQIGRIKRGQTRAYG
jgi:hypothetical protein